MDGALEQAALLPQNRETPRRVCSRPGRAPRLRCRSHPGVASPDRRLLILGHQPAVPDDIGRQDRGQSVFGGLGAQRQVLPPLAGIPWAATGGVLNSGGRVMTPGKPTPVLFGEMETILEGAELFEDGDLTIGVGYST